MNGDGIDDIIIGAYGADPDDNSMQVKAMLYLDHQRTGQRALDLSDLNGTNGFTINGIDA